MCLLRETIRGVFHCVSVSTQPSQHRVFRSLVGRERRKVTQKIFLRLQSKLLFKEKRRKNENGASIYFRSGAAGNDQLIANLLTARNYNRRDF